MKRQKRLDKEYQKELEKYEIELKDYKIRLEHHKSKGFFKKLVSSVEEPPEKPKRRE